MLRIIPLELYEANALVKKYHRHHKPTIGHRFSIGCLDTKTGEIVGASIVGRPVARLVNWRTTVEVVRLVTNGTKNACSILYAASARIAREMGYEKIQTYILDSETGVSLKAADWICEEKETGGGDGWNSRESRRDDQPTAIKQRWAKILNEPLEINRVKEVSVITQDELPI